MINGRNFFVEVLTAIVRPAVTIMFAAGLVDCVAQGITPPTWFITMAGVAFTWYFGDRTLKHVAERAVSHIKEKKDD